VVTLAKKRLREFEEKSKLKSVRSFTIITFIILAVYQVWSINLGGNCKYISCLCFLFIILHSLACVPLILTTPTAESVIARRFDVNKISVPLARTDMYQNSFGPNVCNNWNTLSSHPLCIVFTCKVHKKIKIKKTNTSDIYQANIVINPHWMISHPKQYVQPMTYVIMFACHSWSQTTCIIKYWPMHDWKF